MLKIKKFMVTLMALALMIVYPSQIFANDKTIDCEEFSKAPIEFTDEERASISGSFGTAYIGYMSSARMLNWRLTPKQLVSSFAGTITVTTTSGRHVQTYYVSGSGMSPTGQVSVSSLKKGTYIAKFAGSGVTASGSKFAILPGLQQVFTKN